MTDALLREIERVIFEAHSLSDRDGAIDFDELLSLKATRFRTARARARKNPWLTSPSVSAQTSRRTGKYPHSRSK
jgi:hypothetical protein